MSDIELFNAAREAGMPPKRAANYVHHVRKCENEGRTPLTPAAAALAASTAAAKSMPKGKRT